MDQQNELHQVKCTSDGQTEPSIYAPAACYNSGTTSNYPSAYICLALIY